MALFHFTAGQISKGGGQSSIASAAYRAGEKLMDEYYGQIHDYTNKSAGNTQECMKFSEHRGFIKK